MASCNPEHDFDFDPVYEIHCVRGSADGVGRISMGIPGSAYCFTRTTLVVDPRGALPAFVDPGWLHDLQRKALSHPVALERVNLRPDHASPTRSRRDQLFFFQAVGRCHYADARSRQTAFLLDDDLQWDVV